MDQKIKTLKEQFKKDIQEIQDPDALYLKYFSKSKGLVTQLLKGLPGLSIDEKREFGPKLNQLQQDLKQKIEVTQKEKESETANETLDDLTIPYSAKKTGHIHPTNAFIKEMNKFFTYYGFSIVEGPEIETAEYNFRKLNLPENHPATDLQDTLFIKSPGLLLRTHTSSVEARILTDYDPPIRVVNAGKVYRNETQSKTNTAFFHHYQGVFVDKGVTLQHLKATLTRFHQFLFGDDVELRFRYKYYPEVSPGMGVDMKCSFCNGAGCDVCKQRGWIEVLGSGMIHYNTLKMCEIDPEVYTGFAFGMGLDRLVMQKYGIDDIRKLYGSVFDY
ncbi:phenylalanine--tRNA ligase subunit alpha [candidate division WWE3 bacterium]|nr:phenylalanine--tRNA ligase subunit alpha [candidate division WWE3 bacterium]